MRKYFLGILGMTDAFPILNGEKAADLDGDGDVTSMDFGYLRKYLLGLIHKFPVDK